LYLTSGERYCLSFWYKVDGFGGLRVRVGNTDLKSIDTAGKGGWNSVKVDVSTPSRYNGDLRIFVLVRSNQYGCINIDDVIVTLGTC
jgi:hypothetical protein